VVNESTALVRARTTIWAPLSARLPLSSGQLLHWAGWALVIWIVLFWRLGYPSFWDPDEAHYAETSREMLAANNWLVPLYNGQPFFDKPVLFHWLQMVSFWLLGASEFAARLVPAVAGLVLLGCTAWLGVELFAIETGELAALMLAVLPATFALSAYAIMDMLFTTFVFGAAALLAVAALNNKSRLQYPAYGLVALAVLTKGPVALALLGLAFGLSLVFAPAARRPLLSLRWREGALAVVICSLPWFLWMWSRFDGQFIEGYVLRENVWLFARSLYSQQYSPLVYLRVLLVGLLPWTPLLLGRIVDAFRGRPFTTQERLLWAWAIAVAGFFMASRYRLDHYLYPAAPALCLLAAAAWQGARERSPQTPSAGVWFGAIGTMVTIGVAGVVFGVWFERVPVDLPAGARLTAVGLVAGSLFSLVQAFSQRFTLPRLPIFVLAGLLLLYSSTIVDGFPAFERAKPVRELASWVTTHSSPSDRVASFRLSRWSSSWRFYIDRPSPVLETPDQVRQFFDTPGNAYCLMLEQDYWQLREAGLPLRVIHQRDGLFTTTGRALRRAEGRRSGWRWFVIVTRT
jgi:4-amino-4-deoxy-L-arabinose transferase-like glycosyltransferase